MAYSSEELASRGLLEKRSMFPVYRPPPTVADRGQQGPFLMQKIVVSILAILGVVLSLSCAMGAIRTGVVVVPRGRRYSNLQVDRRLRPGFFWFGVGLWGFLAVVCIGTIILQAL
jgi:hypothetical protein